MHWNGNQEHRYPHPNSFIVRLPGVELQYQLEPGRPSNKQGNVPLLMLCFLFTMRHSTALSGRWGKGGRVCKSPLSYLLLAVRFCCDYDGTYDAKHLAQVQQ